MLFLWLFYWRRGRRRRRPLHPARRRCALRTTRVLPFRVTGAACLLFVAAILFVRDADRRRRGRARRWSRWSPSPCCDRARAAPAPVPWQLLVLVTGLFLVVPTLSRYGLSDVMTALHRHRSRAARAPTARRRPARGCPTCSTTCPPTSRARRSSRPGDQRPAARAADRHERRPDRHAVGLAGHAAVPGGLSQAPPARFDAVVRPHRTGPRRHGATGERRGAAGHRRVISRSRPGRPPPCGRSR